MHPDDLEKILAESRKELSNLAGATLELTRNMEAHHMGAAHYPMLGSFRNLFSRFYPKLAVLETSSNTWLDGDALDSFLNRAARHPRPVRVYLAADGLGDSLFLSAALANIHEKDKAARGPDGKLIVSTRWADFFAGSPHVSHVIGNRPLLNTQEFETFLSFLNFSTRFLYHWDTAVIKGAPCAFAFTGGHFVEAMCRDAGLEGEMDLEPKLFNFSDSLAGRRPPARYLAIQSAGKEGWKDWGAENFQRLAGSLASLAPDHKLMQVGLESDPPLKGAIDLRERLKLPELAALLRGADLFIGNCGGLMVLARAARTPAVLAFSQGDDPAACGYADNFNIEGETRCVLCRTRQVMTVSREKCPRDYVCLKSISVERMAEAARKALERGRTAAMFNQKGRIGEGGALAAGSLVPGGRQFVINSWQYASCQHGQERSVADNAGKSR